MQRYTLPVFVILAAVLRLAALDAAPPPLYQDEASRGYDAWCILETGADRHGQKRPFFLESFGEGDWTAALTTYLTVPFVAVLGANEWSIRLPDAILGVLTVLMLHGYLRRRLGNGAATAGTLILATDPWHISLCRTGHESGFAPFFLMVGLLALEHSGLLADERVDRTSDGDLQQDFHSNSLHSARTCWAAVAGVFLALHTWVYPATRFFTPLFLIALCLIYGRAWHRDKLARKRLMAASLGLVVGAIPLWWTALTHPERLAARARVTLFAQEQLALSQKISMLAANFASNLSPRYFYLRFDELSGTDLDGIGLHLLVTAPLFVVGLILTFAGVRQHRWNRLLVAWLLLYPLPAVICADWNPHSFRTVAGVLWYPIIAAMGWQGLKIRLNADTTARNMTRLRAAALAAFALNTAYFVDVYFRRMPRELEIGYQTQLVRAMQYVGRHQQDADFILVTRWFNQPYIYALLYAPIPPRELVDLPKLGGPDLLGFHQINRIGKYYFPPREPEKTPELTAAFLSAFNQLPPDAEGLVIELAGRFGAGRIEATFPVNASRPDTPALEVRRWRRSDDPTPTSPPP